MRATIMYIYFFITLIGALVLLAFSKVVGALIFVLVCTFIYGIIVQIAGSDESEDE